MKKKARKKSRRPTAKPRKRRSQTAATSAGGQGGSARGADGLTPAEQNVFVGMASRNEWPISDAAKAKAIAVTERNMDDADGRVSNGAVRNLILMDGRNAEDRVRSELAERVKVLEERAQGMADS